MLYAEYGWCCAAGSRFGLQIEWMLESRFLQRYAQRLTHLLDGQPQGNLPFTANGITIDPGYCTSTPERVRRIASAIVSPYTRCASSKATNTRISILSSYNLPSYNLPSYNIPSYIPTIDIFITIDSCLPTCAAPYRVHDLLKATRGREHPGRARLQSPHDAGGV